MKGRESEMRGEDMGAKIRYKMSEVAADDEGEQAGQRKERHGKGR